MQQHVYDFAQQVFQKNNVEPFDALMTLLDGLYQGHWMLTKFNVGKPEMIGTVPAEVATWKAIAGSLGLDVEEPTSLLKAVAIITAVEKFRSAAIVNDGKPTAETQALTAMDVIVREVVNAVEHTTLTEGVEHDQKGSSGELARELLNGKIATFQKQLEEACDGDEVTIESPEALGDTYDEVMLNLKTLAERHVKLIILSPTASE